MKTQILIFVVLSFFLTGCLQSAQTTYQTEGDRVFLKVTPQTTKAELTTIAQEFIKERNIVVDFAKSTFDEDGKIQELNLEVDCNDGNKGSTTSNKILMSFKSVGFERDYRPGATTIFAIDDI